MAHRKSGLYVTTYCNKPHRLVDGRPFAHECHIIPPAALAAERDGNMQLAIQLIQAGKTSTSYGEKSLPTHRGVRATPDRDPDAVAVMFRADRTKPHEVTAVFPELPHDNLGRGMVCYAHVGQHAACSHEWLIGSTRPAKPAEYADLARELESIGYKLRVVKRISNTMRHARRLAARRSA